jgi:anti-anti-sigma factor
VSGRGGSLLRVRVARTGDLATVLLDGELDLASGGPLRARLAELAHEDPPLRQVVVDLAQLDFVDASGIAVLMAAHKALARQGGELVLLRPSRLVRRVLRLLQLEDVLRVVEQT